MIVTWNGVVKMKMKKSRYIKLISEIQQPGLLMKWKKLK